MQSVGFVVLLAAAVIAAPGGVVHQFPASTSPLAVPVATSTLFRSPAHDSVIIKSDQVGGNFAYSVSENQALGVISPVVSHISAPVATTYTVQQPSTVSVVPAHTSTVVSGPSSHVVNNVHVKSVPLATSGVATTYGTWPYASNYWYGNTVDASSPIVYSAKTNVVGIETEKQINQVHHSAPVSWSTVQQPASTIVSTGTPVSWANQATVVSSGTPVAWTGQGSTVVSSPVAATTYAVQQPANTIVSSSGTPVTWASGTPVSWNGQGSAIVSSGTPVSWVGQGGSTVVSSPVATTYAVHQPSSVVATGTTVAGVSPIGLNNWGYGYGHGQPWAWNGAWNGAWNQNTVVV